MPELFADDYPTVRRCGMHAWIPIVIGVTVVVVLSVLVLLPRLWGKGDEPDDPPG